MVEDYVNIYEFVWLWSLMKLTLILFYKLFTIGKYIWENSHTHTHGHLSPAPHSRPLCVFWVHKASSIAATVAQFVKSSQKSADDQMKLDVWRTLEVNMNSESRISQILIYQLGGNNWAHSGLRQCYQKYSHLADGTEYVFLNNTVSNIFQRRH